MPSPAEFFIVGSMAKLSDPVLTVGGCIHMVGLRQISEGLARVPAIRLQLGISGEIHFISTSGRTGRSDWIWVEVGIGRL